MGLLSGLESFGLGGLEERKLYEDNEAEAEAAKLLEQAKAKPVVNETDYIFDKSVKCPICDSDFKVKAVKSNKARLIGTDVDLRGRYQDIDIYKYDVCSCPRCGYTALNRYFQNPMDIYKKKIREGICSKYRPTPENPEVYSYDYSIARYKLALANAVVKGAKASEIAFICLKTAWILRGKAESLNASDPAYGEALVEESEYIMNAYEGLVKAVATETFPIAGMDETTVDYLMAALGFKTNHLDVAQKMISKILLSNTANSRMKDRARALKETILNVSK